jgi:hypothetical protein
MRTRLLLDGSFAFKSNFAADLKYMGPYGGWCCHISQNSAKRPSGFQVTNQWFRYVSMWIPPRLCPFKGAPSPVVIILIILIIFFLFMTPILPHSHWGCPHFQTQTSRKGRKGMVGGNSWPPWPFTQSERLLLQPFWLPDPETSYHEFLRRESVNRWILDSVSFLISIWAHAKMWHPKMEWFYCTVRKNIKSVVLEVIEFRIDPEQTKTRHHSSTFQQA